MIPSRLCHLLMGPPGSGKSTLAAQLQVQLSPCVIVSTDRIRQDLYGDETHQGNWGEIEAVVQTQIQQAVAAGQGVIYDATNAKRVWRMALLQALEPLALSWVGWHLITPLATCHQWNQQRPRQVSAAIIDSFYKHLRWFPPCAAEGFVAIYGVDPRQGVDELQKTLERLQCSRINRANRTQHGAVHPHGYSRLLDFDRLLHLISLLVQQPGLGAWHRYHPAQLQTWVGAATAASVSTSLEEICAALRHHCGQIYGDPTAVAQDLVWLGENGFLSPVAATSPLQPPPCPEGPINPHPYSDWDAFQRLLTTIRFISHHPFCGETETASSLGSLVAMMQRAGVLQGERQAAIRKDIEQVLKPFGILPPFR